MAIEKWEIETGRSSVGFSVRHMLIAKVQGQFTDWSGTIDVDTTNPIASRVEVKIEAASIDTQDADRDARLRAGDFLDVDRYPLIEFRSTHVEQPNAKKYRVRGDLVIHGVKREVVLDAQSGKDPWGGHRATFQATTKIDRKEFGLQWNAALEAGGFLVGDTVDVAVQVEARKTS